MDVEAPIKKQTAVLKLRFLVLLIILSALPLRMFGWIEVELHRYASALMCRTVPECCDIRDVQVSITYCMNRTGLGAPRGAVPMVVTNGLLYLVLGHFFCDRCHNFSRITAG